MREKREAICATTVGWVGFRISAPNAAIRPIIAIRPFLRYKKSWKEVNNVRNVTNQNALFKIPDK